MRSLYYGTADYEDGGAVSVILNITGASANRYLRRVDPFSNSYDVHAGNITWRNRIEDMINSMRETAFRTALQIAADNTPYFGREEVRKLEMGLTSVVQPP